LKVLGFFYKKEYTVKNINVIWYLDLHLHNI
jgi:hypothetical protein